MNNLDADADALEYHACYRGKIEIGLKAPVRSYNDFAIWYTPGVAERVLSEEELEEEVRARILKSSK